jgi:hypothetical protein
LKPTAVCLCDGWLRDLNCKNCHKRAVCRELCPEAAAYADQDYVSAEEFVFMDSEEIDKLNVTTTVWRDGWTTKDDVIADILRLLPPQREIADRLGVTQQYISKVLSELKKR